MTWPPCLESQCFSKPRWVACFKMTLGSPNIMTFWHNMLEGPIVILKQAIVKLF